MIRYSSLASSSDHGNAYLIEGPDRTRILVDCGVRQRQLAAGLGALGVEPGSISAILVTHEHSDHTYCLGLRRPLLAGYGVPLYAHREVFGCSGAARNYLARAGLDRTDEAHCLRPGREVVIGSLAVRPFATPHDAASPLGFVFIDDGTSLGLATDLGHVSAEVARNLQGCTHLILESNHDTEQERCSGRPWHLIARVLGDEGHLSNDQAATALPELVGGRTRTVLLAHLSLDCNRPGLAVGTAAGALRRAGWHGAVGAAPASGPSGWLT